MKQLSAADLNILLQQQQKKQKLLNDKRAITPAGEAEKKRVERRITLIGFLLSENISVYESKISGCVIAWIEKEWCNVSLKGSIQYNMRGTWYPYTPAQVAEILKNGQKKS